MSDHPGEKTETAPAVDQLEPTDSDERLFWVGIGASAGGLEALREFVGKLPKTGLMNLTYVVAQHLSPTHQSMLVQLLGRETDIQVCELSNNLKPEANMLYITPPNSDVYVESGRLQLRKPLSEFKPKPSVDYFFATLAEDQTDRVIGIILSGTGSDGAHGVRAIRAAGGITIAQEPSTAKYDGMPSSAIETGCVDAVLAPDKMGRGIEKVLSSPRSLKLLQEEHQRTDIQELMFLVKQRCGVDFKDYKTGTLHRRISRRMAACATHELNEYVDYVRANPKELDALYGDILISVTNFFRDTEAFDSLKREVEKILAAKGPEDTIRVWIPGCASGEEAYSIVILFAEAAGGLAKLSDYNFQMFATDLDADTLTMARKGQYSDATLQKLSPELRDKYFHHREGNREILKGVRDLVLFSRHNVLEDPPFMRLDLVSCRNLLIYFNNNLQHNVLSLFHYALGEKGILFLGQSESLGHSSNLFITADSKAKIFRRKLISSAEHQPFRRTSAASSSPIARLPSTRAAGGIHELPDAIVQALAPNSLLVDENLDVLRIYGDMHAYTQLSPGSASMNLVSIARKEFRQELRALAYKTLREQSTHNSLRKNLKDDAQHQRVDITIRPLRTKTSEQSLLLISFEPHKSEELRPIVSDVDTAEHPLIAEFEQELNSTREHLQTVVEELETSNEELQSTNEELQSSNEELQSSNEELETANEELQSTNEELLTVNEELQIKTLELTEANTKLVNVKESFDFPLLMVDAKQRIKLYNKAAKKIFAIDAHDSAEPISAVTSAIEIPDLVNRIKKVGMSGKALQRQLDTDEVCYNETIHPYRDEHGQVLGALLTYVDNTKTRQIEAELATSEERYQLAVDGSSVGLWDWKIAGDELYCSPKLLEILHVKQQHFKPSFEFLKERLHPDCRDDVLAVLSAHLEKGFDFNVECQMRQGDLSRTTNGSEEDKELYIWVHIRGQATWGADRQPERMSGSLDNYTEKREIIDELRDSNQALARFAYVCSHDLKEPARLANNFGMLLQETAAAKLDDDEATYLEHIVGNTERMQEMIRDMLTYAQIENKNSVLEIVDCEIEYDRVLEHLQLAVEENNATVSRSKLPKIRSDRMQIFQVLLNLIGNGIKFHRDERPVVHVSAVELNDDWQFAVSDNGIGMHDNHVQKIFGEFQRLNSSEEFPGTGIGLSICHKIVQRQGGRIWVESAPNEGSTFYFTIPKNPVGRRMSDPIAVAEPG